MVEADIIRILSAKLRNSTMPHPDLRVEVEPNFVRIVGNGNTPAENTVVWVKADSLESLKALISQIKKYYSDQGKSFEWKFSRWNQPEETKDILLAEGFEAQEREELLAWHPGISLPPSSPRFEIRKLREQDALSAMQAVGDAVYGTKDDEFYKMLLGVEQANPGFIHFFGAFAPSGKIAATGRLDIEGRVGGLYGGSTIPEFRRQGAFTSLVRTRLELALQLGLELVTVDASPRSLPILKKLGFIPLGETTPYVFNFS